MAQYTGFEVTKRDLMREVQSLEITDAESRSGKTTMSEFVIHTEKNVLPWQRGGLQHFLVARQNQTQSCLCC